MLARLRRSLPPSGATAVDAAAAAAAGAAAQAGSVLDRLVSLAGPAPAEPALLPVRTKPASAGASPGLGRPSPGRRQRGGAPAGARRLRRAAAVAAMLLLVIAAVASAAAGAYLLSILYEPAAPLAAAAAEARAAASRAWAAAAPAGPAAPDPLQPDAAAAAGPDSLNGHARLPGNYTVVVMSYAGRRATLPLVVRKLGGCPSAAEVLVVWNGEDPPDPAGFGARAPVRVRREAQDDLSNRLFPDPGIATAAAYLADDDELVRCADVERAFAAWQASPQALVGFWPRLVAPGPPPQYLGERAAFAARSFNALLTAGEFVGLPLLRAYWSDAYAAGRALVTARTNCEDILLNFVAAAAIRGNCSSSCGQPQAAAASSGVGAEAAPAEVAAVAPTGAPGLERWPPHVVYVQPSRRLDISLLSGVGLSRGRGAREHLAKRRRCAADFTAMYGDLLSQAEPVMFDASRPRPVCWLPFLGCVYF